jgi:hypothetical protein
MSGLLGNASEIDPKQAQTEFGQILLPDEEIQRGYQLFRDSFLFTTRRLILIDRQGMTGSKVEYHSLPYKSITHFSVETAGTFDLDAELKIWISGNPTPIQKQFTKKVNVYDVQRVLAHYVLQR